MNASERHVKGIAFRCGGIWKIWTMKTSTEHTAHWAQGSQMWITQSRHVHSLRSTVCRAGSRERCCRGTHQVWRELQPLAPSPRFYHPGIWRFPAPLSPARPGDGADCAPSSQEAGAPDWFMLMTVSLLPGLCDQFRDRYLTQMVKRFKGASGKGKQKVFHWNYRSKSSLSL